MKVISALLPLLATPFLFLCTHCTKNGNAACGDTWSGSKQFGVASKNIYINGAAFDSNCNYYIAGYLDAAALNGVSKTGSIDIWVIKYDSTGALVWTQLFGESGVGVYGNAMTVDSEGSVYVTGIATGSVDGQTFVGNQDMILVKFDRSGTKQWTRMLGTAGQDTYGYGVAIDSTGSVYVSGQTWGNLDGNTLAGVTDLFLTKYSTTGTKQWTKQIGAASAYIGMGGMVISASNEIYIAGNTDYGVNGNTQVGSIDSVLIKYTSDGTLDWVKQEGVATFSTQGVTPATDPSGDIYISGFTQGSLPGNTITGTQDLFVSKYSATGTHSWTKQFGGVGTGILIFYNSSGVNADGNLYVAGLTDGAFEGNTLVGTNDVFVIKLGTDGSKIWATQTGPTGGSIWPMTLSLNTSGLLVSGYSDASFPGHTVAGFSDPIILPFDLNGSLR